MMRSILVPLDNSPASESVLWRLGVLMSRPETTAVLVHALEAPMGARMNPGAEEPLQERETENVELLAKRLRERGVRCSTVVKEGRAAELILSVAGDLPEGMIAMSTTGRSALASALFGSVARDVLRASPIPVLLFRPAAGGSAAAPPLQIRHILVPLDGSTRAHRVIPHVLELARTVQAEVTLVHVLPSTGATEASMPRTEEVFGPAMAHFSGTGIQPETLVRSGDPAVEIADVLGRRGVDMVACTTHGRSGLAQVLMGSIAEKLVRTSPVPVLVVRSSS